MCVCVFTFHRSRNVKIIRRILKNFEPLWVFFVWMWVCVCVCVCVIGVNLLFQIECYLIMNVIARMNSFLIFSKPQDKPRIFFYPCIQYKYIHIFWQGVEGGDEGGGRKRRRRRRRRRRKVGMGSFYFAYFWLWVLKHAALWRIGLNVV